MALLTKSFRIQEWRAPSKRVALYPKKFPSTVEGAVEARGTGFIDFEKIEDEVSIAESGSQEKFIHVEFAEDEVSIAESGSLEKIESVEDEVSIVESGSLEKFDTKNCSGNCNFCPLPGSSEFKRRIHRHRQFSLPQGLRRHS